MKVDYHKLENLLNNKKEIKKRLGSDAERRLFRCITLLHSAANLADFYPPNSGAFRCHELKDSRKGQFSMWVTKKYRLVFIPVFQDNTNITKLSWQDIKHIQLLEIIDYHD